MIGGRRQASEQLWRLAVPRKVDPHREHSRLTLPDAMLLQATEQYVYLPTMLRGTVNGRSHCGQGRVIFVVECLQAAEQ